MSFFCPECSTLSHLRAKSKLLAGSFETETVSCPWPMPVTSPPPFSHSGHSSLSRLPQRSRPRACALFFPHSSWKILVPDNCTACLLPSFRALLKHLLLREVYPGHSIHSHSPSLPPPPASFPLLGRHPSQFSSVAQSCLTLCKSMDPCTPGFPVHHLLPELAQTHVR